MTINYEPTVDAIRKAATRALELSDELNKMASKCLLEQDLGYAEEAIAAITNAIPNFSMGLIVTRSVRELDKEVVRLKERMGNALGFEAAP